MTDRTDISCVAFVEAVAQAFGVTTEKFLTAEIRLVTHYWKCGFSIEIAAHELACEYGGVG